MYTTYKTEYLESYLLWCMFAKIEMQSHKLYIIHIICLVSSIEYDEFLLINFLILCVCVCVYDIVV